jgi:hypothetical protein
MAFTCTQAERATLRKAINTGASSISYDGKSTSFRNLADMLALEARMTAYLDGVTGTGVNLASVSKGTQ